VGEKLTDKECEELTAEIYNAALEWGFSKETAERLKRLMGHILGVTVLDQWEYERWKMAKVLDEAGNLLLFDDESIEDAMTWILIGLLWEGKVERYIDGYRITMKGIQYIEKKIGVIDDEGEGG